MSNIPVQIGDRMEIVIFEETVVSVDLDHVLHFVPQFRRQNHLPGVVGRQLDQGEEDGKDGVGQDRRGVVGVVRLVDKIVQQLFHRRSIIPF